MNDVFAEGVTKYLAMLVPVLSGIFILWKKLDIISLAISKVDKKKVSHKVCEKRRAECACKKTR